MTPRVQIILWMWSSSNNNATVESGLIEITGTVDSHSRKASSADKEFNLSSPSPSVHWLRWLRLINTGSKLAGQRSSDTSYQVELDSRFQPVTDGPQWEEMSWSDGSKFLIIPLNLLLIFSELLVWLSWGQEQLKSINKSSTVMCRGASTLLACRWEAEIDECLMSLRKVRWSRPLFWFDSFGFMLLRASSDGFKQASLSTGKPGCTGGPGSC